MKVKQADTATQLLTRLNEFLTQLEKLIGLFPEYLAHDPRNTSWNDVVGFFPRYWQKARYGTEAADRDKVQYDELKAIFKRLLDAGRKIQAALPHDEDNFEKKVQKMLALQENAVLVGIMFDYFSASATMGMIHHSIKPLMESLWFCVRIKPSQEFIQSFQTLIGLANTRSSKVKLMLNEMDKQSRSFTAQEDVTMKNVCQRFDTLARLSELMATFAVFSTQKEVKTKAQLMEAARAQLMSIEAGAKPEDSHEIIALRDFIALFGFDNLIVLLCQLRAWEVGEMDSLLTLQNSLKTFFKFVDNKARTKTELKLTNEIYETLGKQCHLFMAGKIDEEALQESLNSVRDQVEPGLLAALENSDFDSGDDQSTTTLDLDPVTRPTLTRTNTMNGLLQAIANDLSLDANTLEANFNLDPNKLHDSPHQSPKQPADLSCEAAMGGSAKEIELFRVLANNLSIESSRIHDFRANNEPVEETLLPENGSEVNNVLPQFPESTQTLLAGLFSDEDEYGTEYDSHHQDLSDTVQDHFINLDDDGVRYDSLPHDTSSVPTVSSKNTSYDNSPLDPEKILKLTTLLTQLLGEPEDQTPAVLDLVAADDEGSNTTTPQVFQHTDLTPIANKIATTTKPTQSKDWLDLLAEQSENNSEEESGRDSSSEEILSSPPPLPPLIISELAIVGTDPDLEPLQASPTMQTISMFELGEEASSPASISSENQTAKTGKLKNTVLQKALFFEKAAKEVEKDGRKITVPFDESAATPSPSRQSISRPPVGIKNADSTTEDAPTSTSHPINEKNTISIRPKPSLNDWLDALAAESNHNSDEEETSSSDSSSMSP